MGNDDRLDFAEIAAAVKGERAVRISPSLLLPKEGVDYLKEAHIAENLLPRVKDRIQDDSKIRIVGGCGANLAEDDYPWYSALEGWLDRGCEIDYLMVAPDGPEVSKLLADLTERGGGRFRGFGLRGSEQLAEDDRETAEQWRTFHFCVFENPSQLWVETNHPEGSTDAYGCYFFPPEQADKLPEFRVYRAQFDDMVKRCADPVVPAPQASAAAC